MTNIKVLKSNKNKTKLAEMFKMSSLFNSYIGNTQYCSLLITTDYWYLEYNYIFFQGNIPKFFHNKVYTEKFGN